MNGVPRKYRVQRASVCGCVLVAMASTALAAPSTLTVDLSVDDPRPVSRAIDEVVRISNYPISYEDPQLSYLDDLRETGMGSAGKPLFEPAGGTLQVRQLVIADAASSKDDSHPAELDERTRVIQQALQRILEVQAHRPEGGRFAVIESTGMLHVVPTQIRNRDGEWIQQASVLDLPISIAPAERSAVQMLNEICKALSHKTGLRVGLASGPLRSLYSATSVQGADNEPARDILVQTLNRAGGHMTWKLWFAPDLRWYALNIVTLPRFARYPTDSAPSTETSQGGTLRRRSN